MTRAASLKWGVGDVRDDDGDHVDLLSAEVSGEPVGSVLQLGDGLEHPLAATLP